MKKIYFVTFLSLFLCCHLFAQNTEYETNMLNFNIQGIKIGTSLSEFKNTTKFTYEYYDSISQPEVNQKVYVSDDVPNMDTCVFRFFDDKLYEVRILYSAATCNKMGGVTAVLEKLVKRYGRKFDSPYRDAEDALFEGFMRFDNIDRYLYTIVKEKIMILEITDLDTARKLEEKKKESMDLGF